ncbi:hypothetical protein B0H17DRAFT_1132723 [Mycena rosella]|uniref:Uncharacterized protein n=1 Tax=Mycena rosella TaxID=1033263 RepID=A0AAD7GKA3_MYCRO|nr:hypothetical protein B0H17DRAFT_1132723 [Mycena rosella]
MNPLHTDPSSYHGCAASCGISHHGSADRSNNTQQRRLTLAIAIASLLARPPAWNLVHRSSAATLAARPETQRELALPSSPSLLTGAVDRPTARAPAARRYSRTSPHRSNTLLNGPARLYPPSLSAALSALRPSGASWFHSGGCIPVTAAARPIPPHRRMPIHLRGIPRSEFRMAVLVMHSLRRRFCEDIAAGTSVWCFGHTG